MGIFVEYPIYEIWLVGFSPDIWLSEPLFSFASSETKFKKLSHKAPAIFHISITCQVRGMSVYECNYENILFIKTSQNIMTCIFALKLR